MMGTALLIILLAIAVFMLYKIFKPYFIKYDTTLLFTGGLGSGKSLESVKTAIVLVRKQRFYKYYFYNWFEKHIKRPIRRLWNYRKAHNKKAYKKQLKAINKNKASEYNQFIYDNKYKYFYNEKKDKFKKTFLYKPLRQKPKLYSNMPIHFKSHIFSKKREWSEVLTPKHIYLLKEITEYSVVLIDEFPQFINQFEFDNEMVQQNCNEFITMFRHYLGSFFIINAQSESDIVVQFRRKLNQAIWCFDFKKHFFGLFYTNRMADIMLSDNVSTIAQTQISENTKIHFGLFPPKGTYDTRCYSVRYKNTLLKARNDDDKHDNLKTTRVLRAMEYISPLDSDTTKEQKEKMLKTAERLERK